jgi:hypothetical protein
MKNKIKNPPTKKASTRRRTAKNAVTLVHADKPVLRHFRLVAHKHTGKLLRVHHTSHLALMGVLVLVGFFLMISQNMAQAVTETGTVSVGLIVQGPAPTNGATITSPPDGASIVNLSESQVIGTCQADSFVVVYNDGVLAGSTICSSTGDFVVSIQLHAGQNVLTARNFDNLNRPGPDTPAVTVSFAPSEPTTEAPTPVLPEIPVIIPGVTTGPAECDDYQQSGSLSAGGEPHVAVVCVPRTVATNEDHKIGVLVWGGTPPYAINFKWGSGATTLISMDAPGYRAVKVHYASAGIYNINIQLTDHTTKSASGESAVEVTKPTTTPTITQVINNVINTSWFETPVPLYVTAVALTLGFWVGDIFNRRFGAGKHRTHRRKAT